MSAMAVTSACVLLLLVVVPFAMPDPVKLTNFDNNNTKPAKYSFQKCRPACATRKVKSFGNPVSWGRLTGGHSWGQWMTDPAKGCGNDIYIVYGWSGVKYLYVFASVADALKKKSKRVIRLPRGVDGAGGVMWNSAFYYPVAGCGTIARYDLAQKRITKQLTVPHAYYRTSTGSYRWGGYSDITLTVSETGLYVIYAHKKHSAKMAVLRLDPNTFKTQASYLTKVYKKSYNSCFIVCARLYCTNSYNGGYHKVIAIYDFVTNKHLGSPNYRFRNLYSYTGRVDYNPADHQLYAWGYHYLLNYQVNLS